MVSFNSTQPASWRSPWTIALLVGGGIAVWCVISLARAEFQQPTAASPAEVERMFQESETIDRHNWEEMWKRAGKNPPPAP